MTHPNLTAEASMHPTQQNRLFSPAMIAVLAAQFLSAFADNAIFVAALAWITHIAQSKGMDGYLQFGFAAAYVLLAPFVGSFADHLAKGRVMVVANVIKLLSALLLLLGVLAGGWNPWAVVLIYVITGIGAAVYSPAKYGILTQLCTPELLVKANGAMEGSTIVAILLGVVGGTALAFHSLLLALLAIASCYAVAVVLSLLIPRLPAEHRLTHFDAFGLCLKFARALRTLFTDPWARVSLIGTSVFWGAGSTLRLLLFAWVPIALGAAHRDQAGNLMGAVSIGIVIGAGLAAFTVSLQQVWRALFGGVLLGIPVMLLAGTHNLFSAIGLLVLIGAAGGFFVVPLNALLQERGHESVGAGYAIAVQNFNENLVIGLMGLLYSASTRVFSNQQTTFAFGAFLLLVMLPLAGFTLWSVFRGRLRPPVAHEATPVVGQAEGDE